MAGGVGRYIQLKCVAKNVRKVCLSVFTLFLFYFAFLSLFFALIHSLFSPPLPIFPPPVLQKRVAISQGQLLLWD